MTSTQSLPFSTAQRQSGSRVVLSVHCPSGQDSTPAASIATKVSSEPIAPSAASAATRRAQAASAANRTVECMAVTLREERQTRVCGEAQRQTQTRQQARERKKNLARGRIRRYCTQGRARGSGAGCGSTGREGRDGDATRLLAAHSLGMRVARRECAGSPASLRGREWRASEVVEVERAVASRADARDRSSGVCSVENLVETSARRVGHMWGNAFEDRRAQSRAALTEARGAASTSDARVDAAGSTGSILPALSRGLAMALQPPQVADHLLVDQPDEHILRLTLNRPGASVSVRPRLQAQRSSTRCTTRWRSTWARCSTGSRYVGGRSAG